MKNKIKKIINICQQALIFFALGLIRLYQLTFSYFLGNRCRFLPTCSEYAKDVIKMHGFLKGSRLAGQRLLRCHPFGGMGSYSVDVKKKDKGI